MCTHTHTNISMYLLTGVDRIRRSDGVQAVSAWLHARPAPPPPCPRTHTSTLAHFGTYEDMSHTYTRVYKHLHICRYAAHVHIHTMCTCAQTQNYIISQLFLRPVLVCIRIHTNICVYICTYINILIHIYMYIYICIYVYRYICVDMYIYMYRYTYVHIYPYKCIFIYIYMCTYVNI